MKTIDLRQLQATVVANVILFDDGVAHPVRPMSGEALLLLRSAPPEQRVDVMYQVAALILPSLSEPQVRSLLPAVLDEIFTAAMDGVDAVEETNPNGAAPATDAGTPSTSSAPASTPA